MRKFEASPTCSLGLEPLEDQIPNLSRFRVRDGQDEVFSHSRREPPRPHYLERTHYRIGCLDGDYEGCMINAWSMFVDSKVGSKLDPRSHDVALLAEVLVDLVGGAESPISLSGRAQKDSLAQGFLCSSIYDSNAFVFEQVEAFHQVEEERYFEILIWFRFWNPDRLPEESRAIDSETCLMVPDDEPRTDEFGLAEGRGVLHGLC